MSVSSAPQGGGVDGRALAKARDAWQNSDEGRMLANDINGPVGGQFLRNRLEAAFCAGYEAALTAQPRTDAAQQGEVKPCKRCGALVFVWAHHDDTCCLDCTALTAALVGQRQEGRDNG